MRADIQVACDMFQVCLALEIERFTFERFRRLHHGEVRLEDNHPGLKVVLMLSGKCLVAAPNGGNGAPGIAGGDAEVGIAAQ